VTEFGASVVSILRRARSPRAALGIFALLAVLHTWPLATNPAHLSRNDNADTLLNTWAVAWVAHQLPRHPTQLFNANIFYPERLTLAYSEAMIVQGVMAIPLRAAGASPVLTYNLLLMAGLGLTGWAFCLLIRRWTGSWSAAYIGGSLAGFNAAVLVRFPHLQAQHVEFVALTLFALDRVFVTKRMRDALLLGVGFALQGLTSIYLLVFSTWLVMFAVLGRAGEWCRRDWIRLSLLLGLGAVTGVAIMAPYLLAYLHLHQLRGFERTAGDAEQFAGAWTDYLSTGSRFHHPLWSHTYFEAATSASFPGIVGLLLAGLALAWPETRRDARVRMALAGAVGCAAVAMAPRAPFYPTLHRLIPLFRAIRVEAHIEQMVLLMLALLAGFGVVGLRRRWRHQQTWPLAAALLCVLVNAEALRAPLAYRPFTEIPRIYADLAQVPDAVVAELPFWPPRVWQPNALLMLNSTRHWRPILNGYSGFQPQSYRDNFEALKHFPDDVSLIALHQRGVTHVVVHRQQLGPERFAAIAGIASLQWQNDDGDLYVYKLR
jgi:hypothetical protein